LTPGPIPQRSIEEDESVTLRLASLPIEPLRIEKIKANFRDDTYGNVTLDKTARAQRKTPQSVRVSSSRLGLM
jgi:hypothetical protein